MHEQNQGLEWVIEHIVKGKPVKTTIVQEHSPLKLRETKWAKIEYKDSKKVRKSPTKFHVPKKAAQTLSSEHSPYRVSRT